MYKLIPTLVAEMGGAYPELPAQRELITRVIKEEEDAFLRTLDKGIRMINDGAEDGAAIAEALRAKADLVDSSFVVRTIDYLRRGGRCSGLEALGAKMLHIRPSIVVADGKMHPGQKYRGRYEHYLKHYIRDLLENDDNIDFSRVVVVHSPSEEGLVRFAIDTVKSYGLFKEVLEAMAGCTICTHCGPDTLGLMFMRKKKKEA